MNINRKLKIFKCALQSGQTPFASLFVTRRCNVSCAFCNVPNTEAGEISTRDWKRAIDRLFGLGVRNISFNGGEPLLRDDIGELVDHASQTLGCITWLFTNLTLLDDKKLAAIRNLDFLSASLNDLGGPGGESVSPVIQKLKQCERYGITPAVMATISKENADRVWDAALETVNNGVLFDFVLVQNIGGLFSSKNSAHKPDHAALRGLLRDLSGLRAKTGKVLPSYKLLRETADFYKRNNWKCPVNKDPYVVVNADGRLMPCQEYASDVSIFDIKSFSDLRWKKAKAEVIGRCSGCSCTSYYQKTFRNPFDLLQETVALLKF